jgi:hypothetical protein
MPAVVHEFTRDQLALALGESRAATDWLLTVAWHLASRRAGQLKNAGLEGGMDELRARAFLDLLLGKDSRPRQDGAEPAASLAGGFAGQVTLTVPLATAVGLADRPGELAGRAHLPVQQRAEMPS